MKLTDRYRPKADNSALLEYNRIAWLRRSDDLSERLKPRIAEPLAAHLESLYPPAEMAFLAKYRCAESRAVAHLRIGVPGSDSWSESLSVDLPRAVAVPSSHSGLSCGGPHYLRMPTYGVTASATAEIKAGKNPTFPSWEDFLEALRKEERRCVPEELEPFIFEIVAAHCQYQAEYRQIADWPKQYREEHGIYPTWEEIARQFPIAGVAIREATQTMPAKRAA